MRQIHKIRKLALLATLVGLVFGLGGSLGPVLSAQSQTPEQAVVLVGALEPRKPPATGFLISPDGYVLTAAHVVCGSTKFRVRLEGDDSPRNDPQQWREATLVPIQSVLNPLIARDLALLKIDPQGQRLPFLKLGDATQVRRGDPIKAIGYPSPLGGIQATTQGTITNTGQSRSFPICDSNVELKNLLVTDVPITGGNSGGPLLKREEVIGIVNGTAALALATPINIALEEFLPQAAIPAYAPQITSLEFPKEFFQGQKVEGRVVFWDANRDVAFAFVEVVELGGRTPVSVQQCCPQVFGKLSGEIRFTIEVPVTPTAPEELTLRVTLLDLAGNQSKPEDQRFRARLPKPEIVEIDFPKEIRADRQPNLGTVKFKDPNADVELARFDRVEGPFEPFIINLREKGLFGKSEGIIDFTIRAQEAGRVTVRVTLSDAQGLRSDPKEFSFTAQPVAPPPQPPVIRVEPDRLDFSATVGGANPASQQLRITNVGGGTLNWTARIVSAPWLRLSATTGTAPSTITASVSITGLTASPSPGLILIEAMGATNTPVTVPVSLTLSAPPRPPAAMVLIPAGSFQMGDSFNEGDSDERPVHTVFVSAFYMDKYEVTKTLWDAVASWAAINGYDIKPEDGSGKAPDHPVYNVSWYEAVKWANARSEREGLTPCYYTDSTQRTVYRTGSVNVPIEGVKWAGCGYRLPTEAEWEKAARGGATGRRFPWSDTDTIQHAWANYVSSPLYSYDTSPTRGYHPSYNTGNEPYTSPVGSFAPNGYGLYDMAGNVWEWVWDWYSSYSSSSASDPRGPASGSYRVLRGGSWSYDAYNCRVADRYDYSPVGSILHLGFRLVRTAP